MTKRDPFKLCRAFADLKLLGYGQAGAGRVLDCSVATAEYAIKKVAQAPQRTLDLIDEPWPLSRRPSCSKCRWLVLTKQQSPYRHANSARSVKNRWILAARFREKAHAALFANQLGRGIQFQIWEQYGRRIRGGECLAVGTAADAREALGGE